MKLIMKCKIEEIPSIELEQGDYFIEKPSSIEVFIYDDYEGLGLSLLNGTGKYSFPERVHKLVKPFKITLEENE